MSTRTRRLARIVLLSLAALMFLVVMVRSSVASLHRASGSSDAPTIRDGQVFFVNRLAYDLRLPLTGTTLAQLGQPSRGDMVLFSMPGSGHLATKRVVAIPGDVVRVRGGRLTVNGVAARYRRAAATEPTLEGSASILVEEWSGHSHLITCSAEAPAPTTTASVPAGHYFLLGDNRDQSLDSRDFGPVSREAIRGRVVTGAFSN